MTEVHRYHPALDGLRAVAVTAVLLYHGEGRPLPGGFLGVDAFFVISGFLITSLLVEEWAANGWVNLGAFWARRVRRLFPALALLLVAVAVYAVVASPDLSRRSLRWDGLATLGYVANWRLVFSHQGYFEQLAGASPLRHAWSLAVEEQWYLLWPIVAAVALGRWGGRLGRLAWVVAGLALGSAVEMAWLAGGSGDTSRAYYGTDARAQALLVGAGLALVLRRWPLVAAGSGRRVARARTGGLVGLSGGLVLFVLVDDQQRWMYRGGFLLCALAWAAVVVACLREAGGPVGWALSRRPLVALGRMSYGVYLWHWPVIVVLTPARTGWNGWPLLALQAAVTSGLALASFVLVEQPVRTGGWRRAWQWRPSLALASAAGLVVIALVISTVGAPVPPPARAVGGEAVAPGEGGSRAPIAVGAGLDPPGLGPPAGGHITGAPPPPASRGVVKTTVLGDSVGFDVVYAASPVKGLRLQTRAIPGCGVLPVELQVGGRRLLPSDQCPRWLDEWRLAAREQPDVALVFLGAWEVFDPYVNSERLEVGSSAWERYVEGQLERGIATLVRGTKTRIGLATVPCFATTEPVLGIESGERAQRRRTSAVDGVVRRVTARHPGRVTLVDWAGFVCPHGRDRRTIDGVVVRPDGMHPDVPGDRIVWTWLAPIVLAMAHRPVL